MAGDIILEWNAIMLEANARDHSRQAPEQGGPVLTSRAFAIVSAAMYDAYNSIARVGDAYLVTVPLARSANTMPFARSASADAAVAQAAHDTLVALYPSQRDLFDDALYETLTGIPNGWRESHGRIAGAFVARKLLAHRAHDGSDDIGGEYLPNGAPGFHDVDPLHTDQGFYAAGGKTMTPFAMPDVNNFPARSLDDASIEGRLAFLQSPEYTAAYNEVLAVGSDGISAPTERTEEQTIIGIYWGYDGRPGLGTPPRLYNQIVRQVASQEGNTVAENARLFALVNIAMADAGVASWNTKYHDAFWRPVMAVRSADDDGNDATIADADWTPLGAPASNPRPGETNFTPPFPAYTSGHATFGAAALEILERFYGRDDISFSFISDEFNGVTIGADGHVRPVVERTFGSFTQAKIENAQSRIYLGIHWRFDADEGIRQGDAVANFVFDHLLAADDPYEDNDSWRSAHRLGRIASAQTIQGLALLDTSDWYRFATPARSGLASVSIQFDNRQGDLTLELYNAAGRRISVSHSSSDTETIALPAAAGVYSVRVTGAHGATNPTYALTFSQAQALVLHRRTRPWAHAFTAECAEQDAQSAEALCVLYVRSRRSLR
jgi:hypothetical protein